jgi:hypothetical protein
MATHTTFTRLAHYYHKFVGASHFFSKRLFAIVATFGESHEAAFQSMQLATTNISQTVPFLL